MDDGTSSPKKPDTEEFEVSKVEFEIFLFSWPPKPALVFLELVVTTKEAFPSKS